MSMPSGPVKITSASFTTALVCGLPLGLTGKSTIALVACWLCRSHHAAAASANTNFVNWSAVALLVA
jgi:hypothetical protein